MDFAGISKLMNQMYQEKGKFPTAIKVNGSWMERQYQQSFILKKEGDNPLATFTGLPVYIDNSIDTFQFVYEKE